jgi:hypothetical protein
MYLSIKDPMKTNTFDESLMHLHDQLSCITTHNVPVSLVNTMEQQVLLIQARQAYVTGHKQSYELILRELMEHIQLKLTGKN